MNGRSASALACSSGVLFFKKLFCIIEMIKSTIKIKKNVVNELNVIRDKATYTVLTIDAAPISVVEDRPMKKREE